MSHRSKQEVTPRRCRVCGCVQYVRRGERRPACPYKALHRKASD